MALVILQVNSTHPFLPSLTLVLDINLPLTAFSLLMVFFFLKLKTPTHNILNQLSHVDWLCVVFLHVPCHPDVPSSGNLIIIFGATATVLALAWGGVTYHWSSYHVLIPLLTGLLCIAFFFYYEKRWAHSPSVPFELLANSTSLSG